MTLNEIEQQVQLAVRQSLLGQEIENPKVDCKSKWYNFREDQQLYAFLKDSTSIANTVGLDGFIIIGYSDKEKKFVPTKFSDSMLRDTSDLYNILMKHVDAPCDLAIYNIEIDSNILNVIHIPPSLHKPHVIKSFKYFKDGIVSREEKHRVFVRKNTGTFEANKNDIDVMYYDRKNIIPEYEVNAWLNVSHLQLTPQSSSSMCKVIKGSIPITIENSGRRSISINLFTMKISVLDTSLPDYEIVARSTPATISRRSLILKPQDLIHFDLTFDSNNLDGYDYMEVHKWIMQLYALKEEIIISDFILHTTQQRALHPNITLTF